MNSKELLKLGQAQKQIHKIQRCKQKIAKPLSTHLSSTSSISCNSRLSIQRIQSRSYSDSRQIDNVTSSEHKPNLLEQAARTRDSAALAAIHTTLLNYEEAQVLRKPKKARPFPFEPQPFTPASLITNRIATASASAVSQQASVQSAIARLARRDDTSYSFDSEMARKLAHGGLVRFRDADERARIVALAEEHARDTTRKRNITKLCKLKDGEEMVYESPLAVEYAPVPAKNRQEIVDRVVKGKYGHEQEGVKKNLELNGTFTPRGLGGFLGIVKRFIPTTKKSK